MRKKNSNFFLKVINLFEANDKIKRLIKYLLEFLYVVAFYPIAINLYLIGIPIISTYFKLEKDLFF